MSWDGSGFTELLARTNEVAEIPVWSPDGTKIAFTLFADEIVPYVMDADGSDLVRLRQEDGVVLDWTPDGRRILLSADRSFLSVRPDGSGEHVFLAEPPEGGRLVIDWSPDGDWIVMSTPAAVELLRNLYLIGGGWERGVPDRSRHGTVVSPRDGMTGGEQHGGAYG